ncbi:hypothetical protein MRX96_015442 [Rhipicephalus microplus]
MIPARAAVHQGPHPPKPPELQPCTTPDQARQMEVAAISIGTSLGAGQQPPTATGQGYTTYSANLSLQPGQGPPMERVSCLDTNLPEGPDDDFSDMSESSVTITYMNATAPSSNGSEKHVDVPPNKRCRGSKRSHMPPNSPPSENTPKPKPNLTIIFKAKNPEHVITRLNPLALKAAFEEAAPDGVLQVRPNERLNLLAVDARSADASERLLKISSIVEVLATTEQLRSRRHQGSPVNLDQADILAALLQRAPVRSVRRLVASENIRIVFVAKSAPEHVILGYTQYRVHKYIEAPRQCTKCQRFGQVAGACRLQARCSRCGGNGDRSSCENEEPQCPNCKKNMNPTSTHCPILRKEKRIHNYKVENKVGYRMTKDAVHHQQKLRSGDQEMIPTVDKRTSANPPRVDDTTEFPSLPTRQSKSSSYHTKCSKAYVWPVERVTGPNFLEWTTRVQHSTRQWKHILIAICICRRFLAPVLAQWR